MDETTLNVPLPKRHHPDELNPEDDELFVGMDMFGGSQPPHMNFKDFFKLKLVREKGSQKVSNQATILRRRDRKAAIYSLKWPVNASPA